VFNAPNPVDAIRLRDVLKQRPEPVTDPIISNGTDSCSVMLDVKLGHEETILAIEGKFKATHLPPARYRDYLPTRRKKALRNTLIFIFATFGSIVAADATIAGFWNDPTALSKLQSFMLILLRAMFIAIWPTAVVYFVRRLAQDG
jgi:hypothetical protein